MRAQKEANKHEDWLWGFWQIPHSSALGSHAHLTRRGYLLYAESGVPGPSAVLPGGDLKYGVWGPAWGRP